MSEDWSKSECFLEDIKSFAVIGVKQKKVILEWNKNYVTLALNYILKNSNEMILASGINRKYRKNKIKTIRTHKTLKRANTLLNSELYTM